MNSKMSDLGDDDPTCVARMLQDFRCGTVSRLKGRRSFGPSIATRLKFDSPSPNDSLKRKPNSDGSCTDTSKSGKRFREESLDEEDHLKASLSSPWESHRLRADLANARAENILLEGRITRLHTALTELEVAFNGEKQVLFELQDRDREKIRDLEARMKVLKRREVDARNELDEHRRSADALRFKLEAQVQALQKENEELREALADTEMGSRNNRITTDQHLQDLEDELEQALKELEETRARCTRLEEKAVGAIRQQASAEKKAAQFTQVQVRLREVESELERNKDMAATIQTQHQKLLRFPELEQELASVKEELSRLREAVPHKLLLEEMVQDLKKRLTRMEDVERQLAEVREAKDQLQESLSQWQALSRDYCEGADMDPGALRRRLNDLQRSVLVSADELADLRSQLKQSEMSREAAVFKLETMKQAEEKQRQQTEQQSQLVRRLQKKLLLITRERDSYRSQLDSYEKELTVTSTLPSGNVQQLRARIDALEKTADGYRDMVERLEQELGNAGSASLVERLQRAETERDGLLLEKEQLMRRRDELERQLEHRALQGDYDPAVSKLLHLRMNPAAEAEAQKEAEIQALKEERDRLQARVTLLEEMGERPADLTQQVDERVAVTSSQEIQELREQVKSGELKLQRFMEVFRTSIREFREVCYTLLGYKVDRIETNQYKVTSVYAQSTEDFLMFRVTQNGEVNLLETKFSASLTELIEKYLHELHSFPMFLSAVNMGLFNQH